MNELTELPTVSNNNELKLIIENYLKSDNYTIKITSGSAKGDNYFGIVYRITAQLDESIETTEKQCLNIILKIPPQNRTRREQFFARPCFLREIYVYEEILPLFSEFQRIKGLESSGNKGFYEISKCYKTNSDEFNETIFLEDLQDSNFEMFKRDSDITFEHAKLVMETIGKFHAISFALKDQGNEKFKEFIDMEDVFTNRQTVQTFRDYMDYLIVRAKGSLDEVNDRNLLDKITKLFEDKSGMDVLISWVDGRQCEPYSVICHGDCWTNNILFRLEENIPKEIRLLDWQMTRYASPVTDLTYFFFCCTNQEFRRKYYNDLLKVYHKSLSDFLICLGSDPNQLFPFKELMNQLHNFGKFGLIMAMMVLPVFTTLPEDVPDLDAVSETLGIGRSFDAFTIEKTNEIYNKRMREVIMDMNAFEYI